MQKIKEIFTYGLYLSGEGTNSLITQCHKIMEREREGKLSFNQLVRDALSEYVVRHGPGNNSFTLDKFGITWTKAQSVNKCGFNNCDKQTVGVGLFVPKNQTFGLCRDHFYAAQNNPKIWSGLKWSIKREAGLG